MISKNTWRHMRLVVIRCMSSVRQSACVGLWSSTSLQMMSKEWPSAHAPSVRGSIFFATAKSSPRRRSLNIGVVSVVRRSRTLELASRCERKMARFVGFTSVVVAPSVGFLAVSPIGRLITHLLGSYLTGFRLWPCRLTQRWSQRQLRLVVFANSVRRRTISKATCDSPD